MGGESCIEGVSCTIASHADLLPKSEFRCQWCFGKVYKSRARYLIHLRSVHHITTEPDNSLFGCYHCPCRDCRHHKHSPGLFAFRGIAQLRRHYQRHHITKNFNCASCHREFSLERELFQHKCRRPNTVSAEDRASPKHDQHRVDHAGIVYRSKSALRLFRNKPKAADLQHANQEDEKENKPRPNGRQMQKCPQCKKKYIAHHQCCEHPCQKCGRVFFCKSALELHVKKSMHGLRVEDKIFVDEVLKLLSSIEDGTLRDPLLFKAFADILPVLKKIQEP